MRTSKQYSFKDEHGISLFKFLHKSIKLKFPEAKHLEEVGKTNDTNYYLYHRMVVYLQRANYIFKDVF